MGKPCRYLEGEYSRQKEKGAQRPQVRAYLAGVRNGREAGVARGDEGREQQMRAVGKQSPQGRPWSPREVCDVDSV